jgi:hypothetical protein
VLDARQPRPRLPAAPPEPAPAENERYDVDEYSESERLRWL